MLCTFTSSQFISPTNLRKLNLFQFDMSTFFLFFSKFSIPTLIKSANLLYFIPPYRFTSVAMGIFLGYVLRHYKNVKWTWWQMTLGHVSAILCFFITVSLMVVNQEYDRFNQSLFCAISSVTWSWIFAWLILASHVGPKSKKFQVLEMLKANRDFFQPFS